MWDDGDGEMGWKDGNRLGKYRQGTTTNLRVVSLLRDNGYFIRGHWRRHQGTSTVVEMQDNIVGYDNGGYAGRQQKIYGTTEMAKWVGRTVTDW